ncbi:cellulose biosynthesis protein BcsS [Methylobacterium oryzihabitans]|uniref:Cellulose biosynthesis protein BcsS n=1 Tax=Methylobacterium oryzihabitans TaxID=2499852 RepID=A0A3S2XL24_9HYPH|nr:cellulose biosynthesis protein BcsS [Methylobacterium oryzihabitans]RVU17441.1 cellulose biosynthesis protein BcsS [Methylobacterium oryzihabitans]
MRRRAGLRRAGRLVGLGGLVLADLAWADERADARTVLFGSLDAGSSSFVTVGAKHAVDPVGRDGAVVLGSLGYGGRSEIRGAWEGSPKRVRRHTVKASVVGGRQWFADWGVVALFVGPEIDFDQREAAKAVGPSPGLRLHGEVWTRPAPTTLLTLTAIAGSARGDVWTRGSFGVRALGAYLGPEIALYADRTGYRKWSLGLHATEWTGWGVSLRLSGGWLYEERERRPGAYGALTLWRDLD